MSSLDREIDRIMAHAAVELGDELLGEATNFFGRLNGRLRARLLTLIANPSPETWDDAFSIILNADVGLGRTLWQAVLRVDPSCPYSADGTTGLSAAERWYGYAPDPLTVIAAISAAVSETRGAGRE